MTEMTPHDFARRELDRDDAWHNKLNEVTVEAGHVAVKSALILNGGASLAVLAFIANVIGSSPDVVAHGDLVSALTVALVNFAWGAFLSALATGISYLVNRSYLAGSSASSRHWEHPYVRPTWKTKVWRGIGNAFNLAAVLCVLTSYVLFVSALLKVATPII